MIYMRARYYEPLTGRFISEDPVRDGANWFVYCWNEPVGRVDPDGRSWTELANRISIGGLILILIDQLVPETHPVVRAYKQAINAAAQSAVFLAALIIIGEATDFKVAAAAAGIALVGASLFLLALHQVMIGTILLFMEDASLEEQAGWRLDQFFGYNR